MPVTSGVPQGSILAPLQFNIFINDQDAGAECTFSKFADDTRLGGVVDTLNGCQGEFHRLEKWANRNLMKFSKGKSKVLHLGRNNPMHQYMLDAAQLESSLAEEDLEVLLSASKTMRQQRTFVVGRPTTFWGALSSVTSKSMEVVLPFYSALVRHIWSSRSSTGLPSTRKTWTYWRESSKGA